MAATPSTMLALDTLAPDFSLQDVVSNEFHNLNDLKGSKGTLIAFICNHCPFVIHIIKELSDFSNSVKSHGINTVYISSNDISKYPQDAPDKMEEFAKRYKLNAPYLFDESQDIAKAYQAACTPDFFLFDEDLKLIYRGQFDSSRPGNDFEVDGRDLKKAVDSLLENKPMPELQIPSIGCNIKWKAGNEPDYFG